MLNKESAKKILRSAGFYVSAEDPDVGGVTMKSVNGKDIFVNYFDFLSNPADHWGVIMVHEVGQGCALGNQVSRERIEGAYLLERLVLRAIEVKAELEEAAPALV